MSNMGNRDGTNIYLLYIKKISLKNIKNMGETFVKKR